MADLVHVEVLYAEPARQVLRRVALPAGSTVMQAIQASGIERDVPGLVVDPSRLGIFSRRATPDQPVGEGDRVDLGGAVDLLADSGRGRLLCEGGPKLLGAMVLAGRLDELCLSVSPQLRAGAGLRILDGPELAAPAALNLHTLLTEDGFLFARYLLM